MLNVGHLSKDPENFKTVLPSTDDLFWSDRPISHTLNRLCILPDNTSASVSAELQKKEEQLIKKNIWENQEKKLNN